MSKKNTFKAPYSGIETINGSTVIYNNKGEYSVILKTENPIEKFCADIDAYYTYSELVSSLIKVLGEGYALQKQDIFCKQVFIHKRKKEEEFLTKSYFNHFEGRSYTEVTTYMIITQERKTGFFQYDKKKWQEFHLKIQKVEDMFNSRKIKIEKLNEKEIKNYIYRFVSLKFRKGAFSLDNYISSDTGLRVGDRKARCISLVDVDEINLPSEIKPFKIDSMNGNEMPEDTMSFLSNVPGAECIIYNQVIIIPSQRSELGKLAKKKNRHASLPDPANELAVQDINKVQEDIARNNKMLVYAHYNIIVTAVDELEACCNYIENELDKSGIRVSKNAYNQLELFMNSFPGCSYNTNPSYDRFLTLHDAAICLLYKEKLSRDEDTPIKMYYTDRQGIPKAIDITGKEGKVRLTDNSNFFSLGPSGSGKSFNMNSIVRQLREQNTDIVLVDTGNSYEGLCSYFNGQYITYTEEKPITMNPFRFTREEDNIEKRDFLKNLIILLWKGANSEIKPAEEKIIRMVISQYYAKWFNSGRKLDREGIDERLSELRKQLIDRAGEEKELISKVEDLIRQERESLIAINEEIEISELSFNSFYEFACQSIPVICKNKNIPFDISDFSFMLEDFYKGGQFEKTLNDDIDTSLFDEKFIVFEIDAIKNNKTLFPIVTLIIMDLFIQKMRIKPNRKALIIEEAWKAIASPLMADYIKYLYKTVRKFWGIVGVVTQELDDIIGNAIVKEAIVNNSQITILLDQSRFKERYQDIAKLLALSEVECRKIWTINSLDNKEGRPYFKEVYIRRGNKGEVFGVEEPPQCYMAYTTERKEKDALKKYIEKYKDIQLSIEMFCQDWKKSGEKSAMDFASKINF